MAKPYHHGDLKSALIEQTLEMVRSDEIHLIGIRELARRLGVSRSAPYRHFSSVKELKAAVVVDGFSEFISQLKAVAAKTHLSSKQRFLELGVTYVSFAIGNSAHYRLMFDHNFHQKDEFPQIAELEKRSFYFLRSTVAECLPPRVSKGEIERMATLARACVHGLSKLFIDGQLERIKNPIQYTSYACQKLLGIL